MPEYFPGRPVGGESFNSLELKGLNLRRFFSVGTKGPFATELFTYRREDLLEEACPPKPANALTPFRLFRRHESAGVVTFPPEDILDRCHISR